MLRNINNKDWGKVVSEMLRWDHQDGKVIKGLTIRREQEAKLWKGEL
jgi:GH24 family phage-related lysozyme (muramidase)